ncbi:uncharacterized protein APUU_11767A [Aspergillus puulaauensis]|uniref:Uncharacterized protein n=1 Tax=Aspergillus puulaauensis TaxID=1220207 RepID=A0A7R8AGS4_9EURO|nr:uncharacterized protein APUU_11767A [Aspergillus puulaauensis]BCS18939.1 hypothetical protein APUU_11767A [Aspergillus puulaauensis]
MPMKWTPEKDQLLLLKILETHELKVNTNKVAEAWPEGDKPTARAITERLVRMRQMVKSTNSDKKTEGHFSIGSGASSTASTSRKPRTASSTVSSVGSTKRKRTDTGKSASASPLKAEINSDGDIDAEYELDADFVLGPNFVVTDTPRKKLFDVPLFSAPATPGTDQVQNQTLPLAGSSLGLVKGGEVVGDGSPVKRQPATRPRRATVKPGMVNYADPLVDGDALFCVREDYLESSASDYAPEDAGFEDDDFA